jgi:uncharacterized protein YqfB (UPF0267 family)
MNDVQSDDILSLVEKLNDMAYQEFEKDFNAWKKSITTRDRSDTDHQNPFLVNTGKALMDRMYVLQSSISGIQTKMRHSQLPPFHQSNAPRIRELGKEIKKSIAQLKNNAGEIGDSPSKTSLEKRYGKWQGLLENREFLSKHLHEEGALGLKEFGYEPFREFVHPSLGFECSQELLLQCSVKVSSNPISNPIRQHAHGMTPHGHAVMNRVKKLA